MPDQDVPSPQLHAGMHHISIRRAVPDDAPGILECLRMAFESYRDSYTPAAFEDTVLSPETIQGRLTEMSVFVAVTGTGDIAGTIGARAVGGGEGHIRGMAVHPALLGTGVAQSLLEAVENDLRERGCTRVSLDTTRPLERAIRFYTRNGFRSTGVVRNFFGMPLFEYLKELQVAPLRMSAETSHYKFIRQAIALAGEARVEGNHPFGALLVLDGEIVLTARNTVVTDGDPTAHAETNLVALAVRQLAGDQIRRALLYTSCEPCAMCVGKMYWAGIRTVVYALPGEELARLAGDDFLIPCRELFRRATDRVEVYGPVLAAEARVVHVGFWPEPSVAEHRRRTASGSPPEFTVRTAVETDIPILAHHRAAMFRDMGKLAFHLEESLERATASYLRDALPRGECLAWVAENDATPPATIGGAGVQIRPILPRPRPGSHDLELGPEAIVLNVYVEHGWRRRGVADALMRAVLEALAARGIRRIVLHASDEGRRLYERLGFTATNEMRLRSG